MPIIVKDFTWSQSLYDIQIKIPMRSVYRENVDLFTSDCYIKAHFNPFLFELFLLHEVNMEKSKCIINEDILIIYLTKREEQIWEELEKNLSKDEKKKLRQEILEETQDKAKKVAENKAMIKNKLDRFTVQQAMDIDNKKHTIMDHRRDEERNRVMDELEVWKKETANNKKGVQVFDQPQNFRAKIIELPSSNDESNTVTTCLSKQADEKKNVVAKSVVRSEFVEKKNVVAKSVVRSEFVEKKKKEHARRVLPKLREIAQVEITHTPRSFPTPSRESTAEEEDIWLKNITLARRATGFVSEDLRPEEQDPQWCKEKGDDFFRSGNFLGAISAYTHGITLSDKLPSLFANRAATHFALGNFNKCANDCSTALDLMNPACEANRRSRGKCIARRAAALARLGYLNKAIDEMKAASKLLPDDPKIKTDIYDMERAWEQNPDSE